MKIVFSQHSLRQLKERNLSQEEVLETASRPQKIIKQTNSRYKAIRPMTKNGRQYLMIVVYDTYDSTQEIVTAFLTSKISKYL